MKQPEIGVQSFTYRQFDIPAIAEELQDTGITALELWPGHVGPDDEDSEIEAAQQCLDEAGIRVCGIGVCNFSPDNADTIDETMDFAVEFGCDYVSVDVPPEDTEIKQLLVDAALERDLLLGIHNHGPSHHYDTAPSVRASIEEFDPVLGACVDTGHFLRADETPENAIEVLGKRVHAVHLKDFLDEETEVVPGTGKLNYGSVLAELEKHSDFHSAFVIEYEADPGNPTPGMRQTVGVFKQAVANR
ncbi:MAG: sugar phosphate isomerase/epimerase family protein [Planctomycetota bacterium]